MSGEGALLEQVLRAIGRDDLADVAHELGALASRRSKLRAQLARLRGLGHGGTPQALGLIVAIGELDQDLDAGRRLLLGLKEPDKC